MKIPKLLAPVRDETSFQAAIQAGADAVYFGIGKLNMRMNSKGIDSKKLIKIAKKAHQKNIKVYITLNVIVYEHELKKVEQILCSIKKSKADAVIASDLAVINFCKKLKIPFHVSTQVNASNSQAALFYQNLGAKAIVLARECTLKQIKEIKKKIKCQLEVFCHGAMCVSVSGRCFMSQFLHNKSANRGKCLQPCRQKYKIIDQRFGNELEIGQGYVLSPKDLCTLKILDKLVKTGVDILKIEGRSRSPEYISIITRAYRQALNAILKNQYNQKLADQLIDKIQTVYNRGFSSGFLFGQPGKQGWAKSSDNQAKEKKEFIGKISNYFKKNKIAELTLFGSRKLQKNDKIQVQGITTGVKKTIISQLRKHQNKKITFPCNFFFFLNDKVYKIISK